MRSSQVMHFWTLNGILGAFLDLFIAYFLLCASTVAFFACKFLGFFGFSLQSPFNRVFGVPSNDDSLNSLTVDYLADKISSVQSSVIRRFPFEYIFLKHQNYNVNNSICMDRVDANGYGFRELEGEASCSSKSDARKVVQNGNDDVGIHRQRGRGRGREFDVKGKGVLVHRPRSCLRRRRKGSVDNGKNSSVSSPANWITAVEQQDNPQSPPSIHKEQGERTEGHSVISGADSCNHEVETQDGHFQDYEFNTNEGDVVHKVIALDIEDKDNAIKVLIQELEEEQAVRAGLYLELEKERNAASSAADEAMAMILRLQEEKASIEMESRQYHRMIEEKSAYDAEEMNILKELLLRREREIHCLEKEVEAYRQMIGRENEQFNGSDVQDFTEDPDLMLHELSVSIANKTLSRWQDDSDFSKQGDEDEPAVEKNVPIVGEEQSSEINIGDDVSQGSKDVHDLIVDMEPLVYDVHVVDDKPKSIDVSNGNESQQPSRDGSERGFLRRVDNETDRNGSSSETTIGLPPLNSRGVSLRRNSTSALDTERTKIDTEIEWLRERLRTVQEGREKLNLSMDNRDKETVQLKLLEDIARQLREIQLLTEPRKTRHASPPVPRPKGLKKRRCRSVSSVRT